MSHMSETARGDLALTLLRYSVLATASTLAGVLAHIVWKAISG